MMTCGAIYSKKLSRISSDAERLYWRIYMASDNYGTMNGDPWDVSSEAAPKVPGMTEERVAELIKELASVGLIIAWRVDGEDWIHVHNHDKHQSADFLRKRGLRRTPKPPIVDNSPVEAEPEDFSGGNKFPGIPHGERRSALGHSPLPVGAPSISTTTTNSTTTSQSVDTASPPCASAPPHEARPTDRPGRDPEEEALDEREALRNLPPSSQSKQKRGRHEIDLSPAARLLADAIDIPEDEKRSKEAAILWELNCNYGRTGRELLKPEHYIEGAQEFKRLMDSGKTLDRPDRWMNFYLGCCRRIALGGVAKQVSQAELVDERRRAYEARVEAVIRGEDGAA
jgi:hypothetical protein